jgi:NAD(P)-dependent dehydrogenase (short-subunit alcohol dehydrogenase family)
MTPRTNHVVIITGASRGIGAATVAADVSVEALYDR